MTDDFFFFFNFCEKTLHHGSIGRNVKKEKNENKKTSSTSFIYKLWKQVLFLINKQMMIYLFIKIILIEFKSD